MEKLLYGSDTMFEFISNLFHSDSSKHSNKLPQSTVEKVPVFQGEDPGNVEDNDNSDLLPADDDK